MNVTGLTVKVYYSVSLTDVEIPQKVYDQLDEASNNGKGISTSSEPEYPEAAQWLSDNIREGDCMQWSAIIEDMY